MPDRQSQYNAVTAAAAQWFAAVQDFDAKHAADIAAKDASNAAYRAFNAVSDRLADGARGYTDEQIIEARQLKIKYEKLRPLYDVAFQATSAASTARNDAWQKLAAATEDCKTNPGELENMGGTIL